MTCKQNIHEKCELEWNLSRKINLNERLLRDDILICPICQGNSIADCNNPTYDINEDMKKAVKENSNRKKEEKQGNLEKLEKQRKLENLEKQRKLEKQRNKTSIVHREPSGQCYKCSFLL
jgi:hypothetical protein